jgi:hypothetical protein
MKVYAEGAVTLEAVQSKEQAADPVSLTGCRAGAPRWRTSSEQPEGCTLMRPKLQSPQRRRAHRAGSMHGQQLLQQHQ